MQVVINIPDNELYKIEHDRVITDEQRAMLFSAITNGIILPKGHGELIDRDETTSTWGNKYFYQGVPLEHYIDEVPAVIPADEETENENIS